MDGLCPRQAWKLFEILDEDNDGEIDADEFVPDCPGDLWGWGRHYFSAH